MLSAKQKNIWFHFYNVFGMTRSGIEPTIFLARLFEDYVKLWLSHFRLGWLAFAP